MFKSQMKRCLTTLWNQTTDEIYTRRFKKIPELVPLLQNNGVGGTALPEFGSVDDITP